LAFFGAYTAILIGMFYMGVQGQAWRLIMGFITLVGFFYLVYDLLTIGKSSNYEKEEAIVIIESFTDVSPIFLEH